VVNAQLRKGIPPSSDVICGTKQEFEYSPAGGAPFLSD